jgi:capsular exopolysaccharide synthesis family protein
MIDPADSTEESSATDRLSSVRLGVRIRRITSLLIRYWWIIAIGSVLGLGVQAYRSFEKVVLYVSDSKMMVNGHITLPQDVAYTEELAYFYGTQVALMKSQDTVTEAVNRVRAMHPEIAVDPNASVDAEQEPRASIFDLEVTSTNPEYAKVLLDAIMDTYLARKRGRKDQSTNEAVSAITEEIAHLDAEIRSDEQQLLDFEKENNIAFIEEQSKSDGAYLVGLNNDLAGLTKEHDLLSMESKDSAPAGPNGKTDTSQADSSAVTAQKNYIEKLKIQRDEYGVYLKDLHPKMIALSDTIKNEEKFLEVLSGRSVQERDARRQDLELQIRNLQQQIVDWNTKTLDLSQRLGTYEQLKAKVTREEALYNQLASSIQNVKLDKSLDQEQISILEPASTASAMSANYALQMVYGLLGGIMAGLAVIYLINRLDDKIDSSFDLEENFGFPIVGQIPLALHDQRSHSVPLLGEKDDRHVLVESHRNIRSSILFRSLESSKPRSLLISSAVPGEGKSTLASNLAITFALSGARVLLIDADMRRGVLHELFRADASPGLSDYLRQEIPWKEAVTKTKFSTLDLMCRGKVPHHPGDLLLGPVADLLIHETALEYDLVLWDSAPLLATDDAANICSKVDGILFVTRVGHSSIHSIRSALEILSQRSGKVFGLIVNAVHPNQPGYHDRYKYKKYYSIVAEV